VGGSLKTASVRRLLDKTQLDIIVFQETLVPVQKARAFMYGLRPSWVSCAINAIRTSGGLMIAWDPGKFVLVPYLSVGGILCTGKDISNKRKFLILNTYGPCKERRNFWNALEESGILSHKNLIIVGDLNFTVSSSEIWGGSAMVGPLSYYFKTLFQNNHLVDVQPDTLVPTWRNGRQGICAIAKRLDRFYVSEELLSEVGIHRSWVEYPYISDHAPILLQLESGSIHRPYPFKLNPQWLTESDYISLVHKFG
jgi:hypothetical protein